MVPRKGDSNELKKFLIANKEPAVKDWAAALLSTPRLRSRLPKRLSPDQHTENLSAIYDAFTDSLSSPTKTGKTSRIRLKKPQKEYLEGLALHEFQQLHLALLDILTTAVKKQFSEKSRRKEQIATLLRKGIYDLLLQASITHTQHHEKAACRTESKYAHLLEIANDAILLLDFESGLFVEANKAACKLTGYSESELKQMGFNSLVSVFDLNLAIERANTAIEKGALRFDDLSIYTKKGGAVPVDISASTVSIGGSRYILGVIRDIKERKALEKKIREKADRLELVNDIARTISSADLDIEAVLTTILKSIAKVIKVEAGSVLRVEDDRLVFMVALGEKADYVKPFRLKMGQGIAGWVAQAGESIIVRDVHTDPRYYGEVERATGFQTRSILAVPMRVGDRTIGVIELLNKIGGRFTKKDLELIGAISSFAAVALQHANMFSKCEIAKAQLAEVLTPVSSSHLAAAVAHEMKDPLGIIKNYVRILSDRLSAGEMEQGELAVVSDEVNRLANITDQLLHFSEAYSEEQRETPLNLLIENSIDLMREKLHEAGIKTELNLERSLPSISVIPNQIIMVLSNLIRLAILDMPEGGTLTLATKKTNSSIYIDFSNTGIRHSKEDAGELFLPSAVAKGLVPKGLGLYMVYNIVRKYEGDIVVKSRRKHGNIFRVTIPMQSPKSTEGTSK